MKTPDILFYMGKGGTGKSTVSALAALAGARKGQKTVVVSMDAAHNLSDIFHIALDHTPRPIAPNLFAGEIDQEKMIRKYLKETRRSLKKNYAYLTAFNLEKHFDILKFSPGLEEYALILAFQEIIATWEKADRIIFDMPPTALSVKFFNLPALSLAWINQLETLRKEINQKKKIVDRVKSPGKNWKQDPVMEKITEMKNSYRVLIDLFQNKERVFIHGVLNPNPLAVSETERIHDRLTALGMSLAGVIWNQTQPTTPPASFSLSFVPQAAFFLPGNVEQLTGIEALTSYLQALPSSPTNPFHTKK